jgi:hypothetical protein
MTQVQVKIEGLRATICKTCERPPHAYHWLDVYFVECSICGKKTAHKATLEQAVRAWNRGARHAIQHTAA